MDPGNTPTLTKDRIVADLHNLGLGGGDLVQVHSSLSALGHVLGGPDTVVDALLETVGPGGTVMMPTFSHGSVDVFDPWHSPSLNGAITEALRLRPAACRSRHPTHAYTAIGPLAEQLTAGSPVELTFGPNCPLGRLARLGGKILLLGVGMRANTAAHVGETIAGAHCLAYMESRLAVVADNGEVRAARGIGVWRNGKCRIEWEPLESRMRRSGMIRDSRIGAGEAHLMLAGDLIDTTVRLATQLCPDCPTDKGHVQHRDAAALGDWPGGNDGSVRKL